MLRNILPRKMKNQCDLQKRELPRRFGQVYSTTNKKLSYRRETARQLRMACLSKLADGPMH